MQANVMKIQQLQSRLDELNTNIASRNTHGALESCHQLLQADKDRYHRIRLCTRNFAQETFPVLVKLALLARVPVVFFVIFCKLCNSSV